MAGAVSFGAGAVEVEGLVEFQAALRELEATVNATLRVELVEAARPVEHTAMELARADISGMKRRRESDWSAMRIGITSGLVYVAPESHGARGGAGGRPNLATLLVVKAMEPAAEREHGRVEAGVEVALEHAFREAGL